MPRVGRLGQKAKERFKNSMDRFVDGIGRQIIVYLSPTTSECPNCYYDKVNKKSSSIPKVSVDNPNYFTFGRCPICFGKGVLTTERRRCIHGIVIWNPKGEGSSSMTFTEAGTEAATIVQIKTDPCNLDIIKSSESISIDGLICKLASPPIIRGIGNKTVLVVELFNTSKLDINSGEVI